MRNGSVALLCGILWLLSIDEASSFQTRVVSSQLSLRKRLLRAWQSPTDREYSDELKREALDLIDCLTSPRDIDDPNFDYQKDARRGQMLLANTYEDLRLELMRRGLRPSGDKTEMILKILLQVIDPSIIYEEK